MATLLRHSRESAAAAGPFVGLGLLIDEMKAAGSKLREREPFYRAILESLSEGLLIADADGRMVYANARLAEITGYPQNELVGKTSRHLLIRKEEWLAMEKRLMTQPFRQPEEYERETLRKNGSQQWVQVRFGPWLNSEGKVIGIIGAVNCIQRRKRLERENEHLRDELRAELNPGLIVGQNHAMKKVLEQIKVVASTGASALIFGETGTGKDLVARAIHELSDRGDRPLVRVNCRALPRDLVESEFFGHARGAFTGAIAERAGRLELAEGGTLFLDEIGAVPLAFQAKLLRVLRLGRFEKLGEDHPRALTARFIAATSRDLAAQAKAGKFRLDLYHRLSVFPIELPPLRERREDIGPLAEHFIGLSAGRLGLPGPGLTKAQVRELEGYDWPGNVRELKHVIERAMILWRSTGALQFEPSLGRSAGADDPTAEIHARKAELSLRGLKVRERDILLRALEQTRWKIYGPDGAAGLLGLKPTTLASKMKKFGLTNPQAVVGRTRTAMLRAREQGSPFTPEAGRPSIEMVPALDVTTSD
jgi:PAS domain S-box-containing protein